MQRATIIKRPGLTDAELEAGLRIDVTNLNDANASQPELFYRVARRVAVAQAERDTSKLEVEEAEADTATRIRDEHAESDGGKKITNDAIAAQVATDKAVIAAKRHLAQASASYLRLQALKDAYIQRGYALSNLGELQNHAHSVLETEAAKSAVAVQRRQYFEERQHRAALPVKPKQ